MSPFIFAGKGKQVTWYLHVDPLDESVTVRGQRDNLLTLEHVASVNATPLRFALQNAARSYRLQMGMPDSVRTWERCRENALQAVRKYSRDDLEWSTFSP
jgi:hypothetical protein